MKAAWNPASLGAGLRCNCIVRPAAKHPLPTNLQPLRLVQSFTTSPPLGNGIAASPLDFRSLSLTDPVLSRGGQLIEGGEQDGGLQKPEKFYARVVPASPAYFTRTPNYITDLLYVQQLASKYRHLPRIKKGNQVRRVIWANDKDYKAMTGEKLHRNRLRRIIYILKDFNKIIPEVKPDIVEKAIRKFALQIDPALPRPKIPTPDEYGRTIANGRRKTAQGRAFLVEGTGEAYVNGKPMAEFFRKVHDRETVIWALKQAGRIDKYNLWGVVRGGGTTGQAEALCLAVGKALVGQEPGLRSAVRRCKPFFLIMFFNILISGFELLTVSIAGCLSRDNRRVERKKPGRLKARKKPAWVKR